jgi:glutamate-1-semialdehyde 2,1-aminomutase
VFDEVITGFRLGLAGAQGRYGVTPDLTTFGKVIGGGLPIGAVGGRRDLMETLTPLGKVFHAGTLAGNPLATAAGLAALDQLTDESYVQLEQGAARLASILSSACSDAGFPALFPVVGTLVGMVCGEVDTPTNFASAKQTDEAAFGRFFHAMLDAGVAMAPGAYEAIFVGLAHDDAAFDRIAQAANTSASQAVDT